MRKTIVVLLISFYIQGFAQTPVARIPYSLSTKEKLSVICSKNIDVFHTLILFTSVGERLKSGYSNPIVENALTDFKPFRDHPAVKTTQSIFDAGGWYFFFHDLSVQITDFPEAKPVSELKGLIIPSKVFNGKIKEEFIDYYLNQTRDFYVKSDFPKFLDENRKHYDKLTGNIKTVIKDIPVGEYLEDYYGVKKDHFYILIAPLMYVSGYNIVHKTDDKNYSYSILSSGIMSTADFKVGKFATLYYAFHEFSHTFVDPVTFRNYKYIKESSHLFEPMKKQLSSMGYGNWLRAFSEHIITAVQLRLTKKVFGDKTAQKYVDREYSRGFELIKILYNLFDYYECDRDTYPDFESFLPRLCDQMKKVERVKVMKPGAAGLRCEMKDGKMVIVKTDDGLAVDKAGINEGDVLLSINGMETTSYETFYGAYETWQRAKEGDSAEFIIMRNGKTVTFNVPIPFIEKLEFKLTEQENP